MIALFYMIIVAIIAVNGCDDDTLLTPGNMTGDTNGYELSRMTDGLYSTFWWANSNGLEFVYFYYPAEVEVKWIFVQRYHNRATYVQVWDRTSILAYQYFGDSSELYDSVTIRFDDLYTDYLRFSFYYSSLVYISRLAVYGCYNTSTAHTIPTTAVPSKVPTTHPSVAASSSPTLEPLTSSPIVPPTVVYATNGGFQITNAIFCFCGVLLVVFLRNRKANLDKAVTDNPCYSVVDYMIQTRKAHNKRGFKVMQTGNGCDAEDGVMQINKSRPIVGEDNRQGGNDHHVDTKTCHTSGGDRQEANDHNVDFRLALDRVSSNNSEVFNFAL